MRFIIGLLIVSVGSAAAHAAEHQSAVSSTLGTTARYQIVQSELAARYTYRIDRVCGSIWQMVNDSSKNELWWSPLEVRDKPACTADGRARYQFFSSGIAVRDTFLMNTDTGTTWQLVRTSDDINLFQKIDQ